MLSFPSLGFKRRYVQLDSQSWSIFTSSSISVVNYDKVIDHSAVKVDLQDGVCCDLFVLRGENVGKLGDM